MVVVVVHLGDFARCEEVLFLLLFFVLVLDYLDCALFVCAVLVHCP